MDQIKTEPDQTTSDKQVSCGLYVRSPKGVLLAHVTHTQRWDIPKGRKEHGELPLTTALRECYEETNLQLSNYQNLFIDHGQHAYIKGKDLHVFSLTLDHPLDLSACTCHTSYFNKQQQLIPEMDGWAWVAEQHLPDKIGRSLLEYLIVHKIFKPVTIQADPQFYKIKS